MRQTLRSSCILYAVVDAKWTYSPNNSVLLKYRQGCIQGRIFQVKEDKQGFNFHTVDILNSQVGPPKIKA